MLGEGRVVKGATQCAVGEAVQRAEWCDSKGPPAPISARDTALARRTPGASCRYTRMAKKQNRKKLFKDDPKLRQTPILLVSKNGMNSHNATMGWGGRRHVLAACSYQLSC